MERDNQLYEFTMKVSRGEGCDLPIEMRGAYVPCYASAADYQAAVKKGVMAVTGMHYVFEDIQGEVREIPFDVWSEYVGKTWPEFLDHLPSQEEVLDVVKKGEVFFGPFAGF